MITIDGSYMEGGGQIIRTALAFSALTRKPFRAVNIRHNRPVPGLKRQHLSCIEALQQLTGAKVEGGALKSSRIEFVPGRLVPKTLAIDIGTAGSITLLLQSLMLPVMFAGSRIDLMITGGTDTRWSIPIDYFNHIIVPYANAFAGIESHVIRRGFFPKGQGRVDITVRPGYHIDDFDTMGHFLRYLRSKVAPIMLLEKEQPVCIKGVASASGSLKKAEVSKRMISGAANRLNGLWPVDIMEQYSPSASSGAIITLWAVGSRSGVSMGADCLGQRGKRAEIVGETAAIKLLELLNSDAAVDCHLADNLIPLLALARGRMKTNQITGHIRSNCYVCEQFIDVTFDIDEQNGIIRVV